MTPKKQLQHRICSYLLEKVKIGLVSSWHFNEVYLKPVEPSIFYGVETSGVTLQTLNKIWLNVLAPEFEIMQKEFENECQMAIKPWNSMYGVAVVEWSAPEVWNLKRS